MLNAPVAVPREKTIAVLYATFTNHTRLVAERVAADLEARGFIVELYNTRGLKTLDWHKYAGAVLASPVQMGKHEKSMVAFVKAHRSSLECLQTAFISVTLSEAGAERRSETPERHAQFVADVKMVLDRFFAETGWQPTMVKPVAGTLAYTRYNFLVRFVMKQIAKKQGAGLDTSRDYEYTDWDALDVFANDFAREVRAASSRGAGNAWRTSERETVATR